MTEKLKDKLEETGQFVRKAAADPVKAITGQKPYSNRAGLTLGDWKLVATIAAVLVFAHTLELLGVGLPSERALGFTEHFLGIVFLVYGLYHARTRKP